MGRVSTGTFLTCIVASLAPGDRSAWAQYGNNPRQAQQVQQTLQARYQQLPIVDLKGKVEKVDAEGLDIKCDGRSYLLQIAQDYTRVVCNGTAERDYLKPGVMVRFEGDFDRKMQTKTPIEELYVVTPSETAQPGIHSDEPGEEDQPRAKQKGAIETLVVVGTIKLFKDNQLQVVADGKSIKVELAEDAEIKVEVDDYTLAVAGDEITVRGRTAQPPQGQQAGHVYGEEVTITLSEPLEASAKAPAKKKKASKAKTVKRASN
ncbi:MAG TPA: hypothetical protein VGG64_17475 [Pirellulales bacterium]|jgi:hypothetical protein